MNYEIEFHQHRLDESLIADCLDSSIEELQGMAPNLPESTIRKSLSNKIDLLLKIHNGKMATCETVDGSVGFYLTTLTDTTVTVEHAFFKPINGSKSYVYTPEFWTDSFVSLRDTHGLKVCEVKLDPRSSIYECMSSVLPQTGFDFEMRDYGTGFKLCVIQLK